MKKKKNIYLVILEILFILYVIIYILGKTGYYENRIKEKTLMTDMKLKEFEQDVSDNKIIDKNDYLPEKSDYSNIVTKSANFVSRRLGTILNKRFNNIFDFIKTLFIG